MKVKQVKDNTYCIDVGISYIPFYKLNENDIVLIDSGEPGDRKLLESVFEKYDLNLKVELRSQNDTGYYPHYHISEQ